MGRKNLSQSLCWLYISLRIIRGLVVANLKSTIIDDNLNLDSGLFVISAPTTSVANFSIEDSENTTSTSYIPYNSSCQELTFFKNSTQIQIGETYSTTDRTKFEIYNNGNLNIINNNGYNNSGIFFHGWLEDQTYTQTIGTITTTYTTPVYTKRASINITTDGYGLSEANFFITSDSDPSVLQNCLKIKTNKIEIYKKISYSNSNNLNLLIGTGLNLGPGVNGVGNFAASNLLIVTNNPECYKDKSERTYFGSNGVVIDGRGVFSDYVRYERYKTYDPTGTPGVGFGYIYARSEWNHTLSVETFQPGGHIKLRKPGNSSNYVWRVHAGYFAHTLGASVSLGSPSLYNFGENAYQLNFTGQHINSSKDDIDLYLDRIGMIVVSSGFYEDLENNTSISINQALPVIELSSKAKQKNVFGVISNKEDDNSDKRNFSFNGWVNSYPKLYSKIVINSIGEGGIWVTNINGNLENGDYITSSEIPGYGMRQDENMLANYTVAKITCDCDFSLDSPIYICQEFEWRGTVYRKAFVGCSYHCG